MAIIRRGQEQQQGSGITRGRSWDPLEMMQEVMRWDPFSSISRGMRGGAEFLPSFDVKETKDAYVFKADLPGVKESDVDIQVQGNQLTVSGEREEEKKDENDRYFTYERSHGSFSRTFTLPDGVDLENVNGELKDGVLSILVPKKADVQPRKISLKGGAEAGKAKA